MWRATVNHLLLLLIYVGLYVSRCSGFIVASFRSSLRQSSSILLAEESASNSSGDAESVGTWNPLSLAVLRLGFTEPAWTSPLNYKKEPGTYACASCGTELFSSSGKFDSGSGWPSFWKTIASDRVALKREWDGRIECRCQKCKGHLGHVFPDGPQRLELDALELETVPDTDPKIGYKVKGDGDSKYSRMPRYCVNGVALKFEKASE